jgi:hypothetical protein
MARNRRARLLGALVAVGLAAGTASVADGAALAAVTCPTVDPGTGAVTPAPTHGVDWAGCDLSNAYLPGADLSDAQLQHANLTSADLNTADLAGANLTDAELKNASVSANLSGATLAGADLTSTSMIGANLTSADLDGATVSANLSSANLRTADLTNANLTNANLEDADLFGATTQGATFVNVLWLDTICPNGANSENYTAGCFSPVSVSTPAATPAISGGKLGNNGWYTSAVTVSWYWVDSNSLVAANCPASTTSAQQGSAVVISASCTDSAGHTATASMTVKIDTTPPSVKLVGYRNKGVYELDDFPFMTCITTDSLSGVALNAIGELGLGARPDGSGVQTADCVNAQDNAGNVAPKLTVRYTVIFAFGGYISPKPGSSLRSSTRKIVVRFRLANFNSKIVPTSSEIALTAVYGLRATLRGPGIKPVISKCTWNGSAKAVQCSITHPRHVKTGKRNKYTITVTENLGSGFLTAPADAYSQNPEPIHFK